MAPSIRNFTRLFLISLVLSRHAILAQETSTGGAAEAGLDPAQKAEADTNDKEVTTLVGTRTRNVETTPPASVYTTITEKITLKPESSGNGTETQTGTITGVISSPTFAGNATGTGTAEQPKNTQPCNNYVELCERKYSNVTQVGCHNSPFVREGSSAANQQLDVIAQLNDGVRFLQAQMWYPTDGTEPHFCHGSCDILDAGPITDWLGKVKGWVDNHPYDVVTILLGNGNYSNATEFYVPWIEKTGILKYAYHPPVLPMELDDWPTLGQMIIEGKRVVMFMDYEAQQKENPWLIDEFVQAWETPFDPVDRAFPCDVERPPGLNEQDIKNRFYILNHNLNVEFSLFGASVLVPAVAVLNETNAVEGEGSLGESTRRCEEKWGRAPNVLNVDYYNFGNYEGSVFEVAAMFNNVTYKKGSCCGAVPDAGSGLRPGMAILALALGISFSLI